MKEYIIEIGVIVIALLTSILSALLSKWKLGNKNNNMLKVVDTLMMIAEFTGLDGEDKKKFVLEAFEDFKLGRIDNINEYIDDKITLANGVNVKKSSISKTISDMIDKSTQLIEEQEVPAPDSDIDYPPKTEPETMDKLQERIVYLENMLRYRNEQLSKLKGGQDENS